MSKRKIPEEDKIRIGHILKEIRKKKELTQIEVERATGLSKKRISYYETNKSIPPLNNLLKLTRYYEISLDYLFFGSKVLQSDDFCIEDKELSENIKLIDKLNGKEKEALKLVVKGLVLTNKYKK